MPSQRYRRKIRQLEFRASVLMNPLITTLDPTSQTDVSATSKPGILNNQTIQQLNAMIQTNVNPEEILTFYNKSMLSVYNIIDKIIKGDEIDEIIAFAECLQNYVAKHMTKYNLLSQDYAETYYALDHVRNILISIIQNIIDRVTLSVVDKRIEYLTTLLDTIRQQDIQL